MRLICFHIRQGADFISQLHHDTTFFQSNSITENIARKYASGFEAMPARPGLPNAEASTLHFITLTTGGDQEQFVEYDKMIYLDGDIQVFDNIDHLFDSPDGYFYAVMDCFCEKTWSYSPQHKIGYCQQCPERVKWPKEMGSPPPLYFNAGMFVFEPNLLTYHELLETLKVTPPTSFAEQDFLNMFFKDVYKPIPPVYNLVLAMLWRHPENVQFDKVKVAHYCAAGSKPWRYTGKEENMDREDIKTLVKKWWDIYEDESLDYKNAKAADHEKLGSIIATLTEEGVAHEISAPSAA